MQQKIHFLRLPRPSIGESLENGAANEGTLGTKADASMWNAPDAVAYVMDDGLTSLSGDLGTHNSGYGISVDTTSKSFI